jgi:hypothetical protein
MLCVWSTCLLSSFLNLGSLPLCVAMSLRVIVVPVRGALSISRILLFTRNRKKPFLRSCFR